MGTLAGTALLLVGSNVFMTLAWYGHLRWLDHRAWWIAVLAATRGSADGIGDAGDGR